RGRNLTGTHFLETFFKDCCSATAALDGDLHHRLAVVERSPPVMLHLVIQLFTEGGSNYQRFQHLVFVFNLFLCLSPSVRGWEV
uniref:Uncharacterized protein n=1 Tax=Oryzias latipes TaxID=8090 RepID=A0A3P9IUH6_ORYLA